MIENILEVVLLKKGIRVVPGQALLAAGSGRKIPGVGGRRRGHPAKKARQLPGSAEAGVFLVDQLPNQGEVVRADFRGRRGWEFLRRPVAQAARTVTAGRHFFAKVTEEGLIKADRAEGMIDNLVQTRQIGIFTALEEFDEPVGESLDVVRFPEEAVSLAQAGWLDCQVAKFFKIGEGLDDFLARFAEAGRRFLRIDFEPFPSGLGGIEKPAQKVPAFRFEALKEMIEIAGKGHLVGGIERSGGLKVAFQFEVGEKGGDDQGADVVGPGKLVGRDIELTRLVEEEAENGTKGVGLRGVAVGEIGERPEVIAAGQEFTAGRLPVAARPPDLLGVIFKRFGEVEMIDGPDIGFIDPHAKSNGGADDRDCP